MAEAPPPVDAYIPASDPNEGRLMRKIRESPLMAGGGCGHTAELIWAPWLKLCS